MPNGFVNVLKAPGITSHDIVSHLRKVYGLKKIGHAGTLDPAAAGVLPVALGKATRMLEYMDDVDKSYKVEVTFGLSTDTGDDTGKIIETMENYTMPTDEKVKEVEDALADGSLHVFDTSTFTVDGKELTTYKKDGSDTEYISDGYFHESEYGSAPAFDVAIDGITSITE